MSRWIVVFLVALVITPLQAASEGDGLDKGLVNPGYHPKPHWFKESFLDIREDIDEAAEENRRLILYFYQDGCPYCNKLLQDNFGDLSMAEKTQAGFDVVAVNMWGDREVASFDGEAANEKTFAKQLRVQYTPTLVFLDETGKVVLRVNGYLPPHRFDIALDYVGGRKEKETSFRTFLAQASPTRSSGKLHREESFLTSPHDFSKPSERPLLVMFEQRQCRTCDELHLDILKRPAVRKSLEAFDVALLDMWSSDAVTTPDGRSLSIRDWASELDVHYAPTLVFFSKSRGEVFRAEAYLKAFHVHGALDYVATGAYRDQPEYQRYLQERREEFEARGIKIDLWE